MDRSSHGLDGGVVTDKHDEDDEEQKAQQSPRPLKFDIHQEEEEY